MSPGPSVHDPGKNGENKEDEMESMEAPPGNIGVAGNSSEEEEPSDEMPHSVMGYELLSQGVDFPDEDSDDDDDDDDDSEDDNNMADVEAYVSCQQNFTFVDEKDVAHSVTNPEELNELNEIWKTPRPSSNIPIMGQDEVNKIKSMMTGFTLPSSHVPDWANVIPEDEWKARLISSLKTKQPGSRLDCNARDADVASAAIAADNDAGSFPPQAEVPNEIEKMAD